MRESDAEKLRLVFRAGMLCGAAGVPGEFRLVERPPAVDRRPGEGPQLVGPLV